MKKGTGTGLKREKDEQASSRKGDHIDLAFESAVHSLNVDDRFMYEPMLSAHPRSDLVLATELFGKEMQFPIWVSSMTGGTEKAAAINFNLARVCGEFGLGMGLGSCRQLLYEDTRKKEFDIRREMPDQPMCINLGIAQVEEMISSGESGKIEDLASDLDADGLIVHVNPLQEWLQPEGDRIKMPPLETIRELSDRIALPLIVKEVGQGFGRKSLEALLNMDLEAVDLAGFGGTNFSKLELLRSDEVRLDSYRDIFKIGHTCEEMLVWINEKARKTPGSINCRKIIFSGGIRNFLDGHYFINKCQHPAIYAQASAFLKYATNYEDLKKHVRFQIEGLKLAKAYLTIKNP